VQMQIMMMIALQVRVVVWDAEGLLAMASGACGPALPAYWRALALYNVSAEFTMRFAQVWEIHRFVCCWLFAFSAISAPGIRQG
jgi:hypothetical protein